MRVFMGIQNNQNRGLSSNIALVSKPIQAIKRGKIRPKGINITKSLSKLQQFSSKQKNNDKTLNQEQKISFSLQQYYSMDQPLSNLKVPSKKILEQSKYQVLSTTVESNSKLRTLSNLIVNKNKSIFDVSETHSIADDEYSFQYYNN